MNAMPNKARHGLRVRLYLSPFCVRGMTVPGDATAAARAAIVVGSPLREIDARQRESESDSLRWSRTQILPGHGGGGRLTYSIQDHARPVTNKLPEAAEDHLLPHTDNPKCGGSIGLKLPEIILERK